MLTVNVVSTPEELEQIYQLNQENLKQNLTPEEKVTEGFVTWLYSPKLLQQMHSLAPSIIVKDNDKVVAYALATLKESSSFHADLKIMIDNINHLEYNNEKLSAYNYYCMGQICVNKDYRGKGLVKLLYTHHKEIYSGNYQLLLTEISTSNIRSIKAHANIGFKNIHTYRDQLDEWNVVVWDWN